MVRQAISTYHLMEHSTNFIIKKEDAVGAEAGDKVIVEIIKWEDHKKSPFAKDGDICHPLCISDKPRHL